MDNWSPTMAWIYKTFLGSPLKLWASIGHWAIWHFDLNKYSEQQVGSIIRRWNKSIKELHLLTFFPELDCPLYFHFYGLLQKPRVLISLAAVFAFIGVGFPLIVHYTGWVGLAKYWLMPWLGYHFWMSESVHMYDFLLHATFVLLSLFLKLDCRHVHGHPPHSSSHPFQAC